MIKETSLLHYPDYRGTDTPYDEYIFDDEKGKTGYYFEIYLSNGMHQKFPNTETILTFTTGYYDEPVSITSFSFHCSKGFDPGEVRFQPYYQKHMANNKTNQKRFINNDYPVDKEYINDLIFTKESVGSFLIQGELVDPRKTKRKPAKDETVYYFITNDKPQVIAGYGTFSIGIRTTNHWDVKFNGAYHNKMYMLNDDCDGFIWEKYHEPNDYIIVFGEWYSSYYWHNKEMILYPNDRYAIPTGMTNVGSTNRGGITKDFFVRGYYYSFYDIGGNWYVTKDGHDWIHCTEQLRPDNSYGNWTPKDNRGIFIRQNHIYLAEIADSGQIHFEDIGPIGERSIVGDGCGFLFYTDNNQHAEFKTIYAMDSYGSSHATVLNTSEYTISRISMWNGFNVIEGSYINPDYRNQRFIGISEDGFATVTIYTTLAGQIPNYGRDFGWHIWGRDIYWSLRRQDPKTGSWYVDIGNLGTDQPFRTYQEGTLDVSMELCGMSSNDASRAYYKNYPVEGKYLKAGVYVPDTPSLNSVMYFRDGKPSYAFGHLIRFWEAWGNVLFLLVMGQCNRRSDVAQLDPNPPWTSTNGSFAFDFSYNYMIDPDNETWIYPHA